MKVTERGAVGNENVTLQVKLLEHVDVMAERCFQANEKQLQICMEMNLVGFAIPAAGSYKALQCWKRTS